MLARALRDAFGVRRRRRHTELLCAYAQGVVDARREVRLDRRGRREWARVELLRRRVRGV